MIHVLGKILHEVEKNCNSRRCDFFYLFPLTVLDNINIVIPVTSRVLRHIDIYLASTRG